MSKEEYWFKHASNAKDDPKCMLLIEELGLEGYGIFWVLIELLRDQPGYKANIRILPVIARRYNTTLEKIKMVIQRFDLFYVDQEELFFSPSLIRRMQPLDKMREAGRIGGKKSGEIRQLKAHSKGASKGASSTLEPTEQNRTEKNRTDKEKHVNVPFEKFWDTYGRKVGSKSRAEKLWHKLQDSERDLIMQKLPAYVSKFTDKQYQPYPTTFLNEKRWEAEHEMKHTQAGVIDGGTF